MPSGYTADLKLDTPFEEFAFRCARGMGALIMMRDEPMNAPIPDSFAPSTYEFKALESAIASKAAYSEMSAQQLFDDIARHNAEMDRHAVESRERYATMRAAYERMIGLVEAWQPPTEDHVNFKKFMLTQLRESLEWDCHEDRVDGYYPQFTGTPDEWRQQLIVKAERDIAYYQKAWQEEQDRTKGRNDWIRALRKSLHSALAACQGGSQ